MTVKELKRGDQFKIGKQRSFRTFSQSFILKANQSPPEHAGKMLVIYNGCSQMVVDPSTELSAHAPCVQ
jgi:hypothetical protein